MDSFTDDYITNIAVLKSTQVGATEVAINMVGYTMDREPSRLLYVLPDDDLAKDFSSDRLQKALKHCPTLENKFNDTDSKNKVLRFNGGFIKLEGAGSPGKLASWSVPKIIMDEIDKYPKWSGREASPLKLAEERAKNWANKKIVLMSTPTLETGNIYQAYLQADARYKYYVPCPACGEWQTFNFENLKMPHKKGEKLDPSTVRETAYYQCCNPACEHKITDAEKKDMLVKGRWKADESLSVKPRKIAFYINAMYSPWVSFGAVAEEFVRSKDEPSRLMNFVNSWLGEPWKPKSESIASSIVLGQRTNLHANIVPKWAKLLTGGVDVQKGYFYWVVRAWGANMTSQKIANGTASTFGDIQKIMDNWWAVEDSDTPQQVSLYCMDCGYNTDAVYEFCYNNSPIAVPVKGSSRKMEKLYSITPIQPKTFYAQIPLNLYIADTDQYKDMIFARMNKGTDEEGSWRVDADTTREYAEMICSEHKVVVSKGRYDIETWVPVTSAKPNHYLDCEVYCAVAGDIMNVRTISDDTGKPRTVVGSGKVDVSKLIPKNFEIR